MDWWNDFIDWTSSDTGWRVISGALIPFVAIIVAGVVAALIGRGATKRVVSLQERESKNAAVAAIISAARKAASWGSLGHDERNYADHLAEDADIRLRLLPIAGAPLAANWAQHEIADIKKNSSTFSFQAEQSLAEFRDRLLDWQARPGRARKLFKSDLERWKFESPDPDAELIKRQQDWSADQADAKRPAAPPTTPAPTPTTTSLRPAPQRPGGPTSPAPQGTPAAASASTAVAPAGAAAFSATRNAGTPVGSADPNATTPISDGQTRSYAEGVTRPYAEGVTRPYGDDQVSPVRPALGSPRSPAPTSSQSDEDNADVVDDARPTIDSRSDVPGKLTAGQVDAAAGTTNTTSVPTRIADAPLEPADADETSEATHTQPISANELRRRAEDDE
ncbi:MULTISPECIES: hypothetical protein [unclassified Curtobacterium]|uniref:hypothetical protein n=1 Tax=unclassified Curtobacterium TaxID=257496 RepID=UPI0037F3135A